jgi:Xaa-Pro aminopeptidase
MFLQHFKGLSFPTISSVGSNAAIIHYSPEANTCAELDADKIYLCDSGAQVECISLLNFFCLQTS